MNMDFVNDGFKQMRKLTKVDTTSAPLVVLPVSFVLDNCEDVSKFGIEYAGTGFPLPFNWFRLYLDGDRGNKIIGRYVTIAKVSIEGNFDGYYVNMLYGDAVTTLFMQLNKTDKTISTTYHIIEKNKPMRLVDNGHSEYHGLFRLLGLTAWAFSSDVMQAVRSTPTSTIPRSVEWVQARSYYTVVHRRHPANNRNTVKGSEVRDTVLQRIAHARKAHIRVLRSDRFGANKGKIVNVRSSWVGPKEWQDAASKQIYTVVDLNK